MSTKSRTLPFVCALVTLFASDARAAEYTFTYEATVTSAEVNSVVSVGDPLRITFTFDNNVTGTPQLNGGYRYPLVAGTGRAGTKSWSFDNVYVDVKNDYPTAAGTFIDEYRVSLGLSSSLEVQFVLDLFSEGATRPEGLTGFLLNLKQPNPAAFQSKSLTVRNLVSGITHTAIANAPVVVVPSCYVHQNVKMTGRAMTVEYRLNFTESGTLNLFLTSDSATRRLFSVPFGPISDTPMNLSIPDLPIFGVVGFMTTITTNQRGIVCWDFDIIDTGRPSP